MMVIRRIYIFPYFLVVWIVWIIEGVIALTFQPCILFHFFIILWRLKLVLLWFLRCILEIEPFIFLLGCIDLFENCLFESLGYFLWSFKWFLFLLFYYFVFFLFLWAIFVLFLFFLFIVTFALWILFVLLVTLFSVLFAIFLLIFLIFLLVFFLIDIPVLFIFFI